MWGIKPSIFFAIKAMQTHKQIKTLLTNTLAYYCVLSWMKKKVYKIETIKHSGPMFLEYNI